MIQSELTLTIPCSTQPPLIYPPTSYGYKSSKLNCRPASPSPDKPDYDPPRNLVTNPLDLLHHPKLNLSNWFRLKDKDPLIRGISSFKSPFDRR